MILKKMVNKICNALELSAKETHVLESFNKSLTLNSDMALKKIVMHACSWAKKGLIRYNNIPL